MTDHYLLVNALIGLVGVLVGIGGAQAFMLKKINANMVGIAEVRRDMRTVFDNTHRNEKRSEACEAMHVETLALVRESITQNSALITKLSLRNPEV